MLGQQRDVYFKVQMNGLSIVGWQTESQFNNGCSGFVSGGMLGGAYPVDSLACYHISGH